MRVKEQPSIASVCPPADDTDRNALQIDGPGEWLVLSDTHVPHHDKVSFDLAVQWGQSHKVVGVLFNGDMLDSGELSRHDRDRDLHSYAEEIKLGRAMIKYLRDRFPKARMIYKAGNHEERLDAYVMNHAAAFRDLEEVSVPNLLQLDNEGVEWVCDGRVVRLGKINVLHGHEYRGGGGGVNPARWLTLRAKKVTLAGHFHRTSEHTDRDIENYNHAAWTTGCLCNMWPRWLPLNQWNHGFAVVRLKDDGNFFVRNYKVVNGEVV